MRKRQKQPNLPGTEIDLEAIREQPADTLIPPVEKLLHELQVHQFELEIQNEELLQSRDLLEESRDRYVDFYDFAPVAYLTLNHKALIAEINLTGALMLGEERDQLRRRRFAEFVAAEDNELWHRHFMAVRQQNGILTCELRIQHGDGSRLHVQVDSLRLEKDGHEPVVRIALTDITELKRAEAALHESETQKRLLEQREIVQTSLDGFLVVDTRTGQLIEVNDAFCRMTGYSREELLTMHVTDLDASESPATTAAHTKKIIAVGYDRFETRHRHKQGHLLDVEVSASYSDLDGGVNLVFVRDITERKQAEKLEQFRSQTLELLSKGASLHSLLEAIVRGLEQLNPEVICSIHLLDSQGKHLVNAMALNLPDFYNDAINGIGIGVGVGSCGTAAATGERVIVDDIQTHPYWAPYKELAARAALGACWSEPIRSSSGQVLGTFAVYHHEAHSPSAAEISIIEKSAHLVSIAIERKRVEDALLASEERMRLFFERQLVGMAITSPEKGWLQVNDKLCEMLGYTRKELLRLTWAELTYPADLAADVAQFEKLLNGENDSYMMEQRFVRKDGGIVFTKLAVCGVRRADQSLDYVLALLEDITEIKQAERQLHEFSAHIQAAREEEKTHIAREIHDELGSTMAALKIDTSLLRRKLLAYPKTTPFIEHIDSMLQVLDSAIASTRRIITDLRPTVLDTLGLLEALKWQADQFHKHTGIECLVECVSRKDYGCTGSCSGCEEKLDEPLSINLFRICQEALTNAARHSGASRVKIEFRPANHEIALLISDNGCGMPEGHVIASTSHGMRGMRERVEHLGGQISFHIPSGGGLGLTVRLPRPADNMENALS